MPKYKPGDIVEYRLGPEPNPYIGIYLVARVNYRRSWKTLWLIREHTGYYTLTWYGPGEGGTTCVYHIDDPRFFTDENVSMPAMWTRGMNVSRHEMDSEDYEPILHNKKQYHKLQVRKLTPLELMIKGIQPPSKSQLKRYRLPSKK